jgi:SAM-dependent methyltransferase
LPDHGKRERCAPRVLAVRGYRQRVSVNAIYRQHADAYARSCEHGLPNAAYDRPAILHLAGDITARRVLELGCAAGVLTRQLVDHGASVLALDREPRMAALARQRLDGRARVEVADLERPLDMVPDACIDVVVASLVLHYIKDWRPLLGELHRCLVPSGALVFSIHHPITGWQLCDKSDYHRTELVSERWDWDGQPVTGQMYRRPISAIFSQLSGTGFTVDVVDEPQPETAGEPSNPDVMQILRTLPVFLFIRALRA